MSVPCFFGFPRPCQPAWWQRFLGFSLVAVSGDRLGNSEQMLQGEVLYFGRQVGACEIPDSTVRGRPVQGHVFLGFSPNVCLGFRLKEALKKKDTFKKHPERVFVTLIIYIYIYIH